MASIGLKKYKWAKLKPDNLTYDVTNGLKSIEGAIECKPKYNFNEAQLPADDVIKEDVSQFKDGDLTIGMADENDAEFDEILGKTRSADGESVSNVDDKPEYVGFGQIVTKIKNGKKQYKVEFLPKVKFKPFIPESKTSGDKLEFTTPSVEGKFYANAKGDYEKHKTFENEVEAETYLNSLFGYTTSTKQSTPTNTQKS